MIIIIKMWVFKRKNLNTSSRPPEHPGGIIIGCKDKRAPMQYHVGACFSVAQFIL